MKKGCFFLLTVLLALSLLAAPALAATTNAAGGSDARPDTNPAPTAAPAAEPTAAPAPAAGASLHESLSYDTGVTTISWDDAGSGATSYRVYLKVINNGTAENTQWFMGDTTDHFMQVTECLPGKSYSITLTDQDRQILDSREYTLPEAPAFQDGKLTNASVKVSLEPRKLAFGGDPSRDTKKVKSLKASEIKSGLDSQSAYHGVKYTMKMPQLAKPRSFFVTLAFESPDGYLCVEDAEDITFDRVNNGYQTIWWYITGTNFFRELNEYHGEIPTGTYTIYLYWDGMWVNTSTFQVQ